MSNVLTFNRHRPPVLHIEMPDEQGTVINVTLPTVELQEELREYADELNTLLDGDDIGKRAAIYDLAARLMSCNRNMRVITSEQLRTVYNLDEEDLVLFFHAYVNFLQGIENAKN